MHPKNLLVAACLFTGICLGVTAGPTSASQPMLSQNVPSQRVQPRSQGRDWSQLVINAQDLPGGFQAMPPEELAQLKQELRQEDFSVESLFAFMEPNNFEMLVGMTTSLKNQQEQKDFEAILASPESLQRLMTEGMGATQILRQTPLRLENVGQAAAGVNLKLNLEEIAANLDIVAFRRDAIGVLVFLLYLEGQTPRRPIANLAQILDRRALSILAAPN